MLFAAAMLGFALGFVGSIPVAGPIAALVFRRGLENRPRSALFLASGAAVAEAAYAYLAFWGLSQFVARYAWIEPASRIGGAVVLTILGVRFVHRPSARTTRPARERPVDDKRSFLLGLGLTAFNPMLIAAWTAAVTALYSLDLVQIDARAALSFS